MNEKELEIKFCEGLFEDHTPSGKISVSKLIYPCLRKSFYEAEHGQFFDINTAYTFWLGKAIHRMSFLKEEEEELEYQGIIGRIDEYENETLVEKKSCNSIPRYPNNHHKTQLEYYFWLCAKNKKPVKRLWLLYLEKKYPAHKFFEVIPRPLEEIEKEILERKKILVEAFEKKEAPERHLSWLCKYCSYTPLCFSPKKKDA